QVAAVQGAGEDARAPAPARRPRAGGRAGGGRRPGPEGSACMEHLSLELLSRLVGEDPTADERIHLDECGRCAAELEALRRQAAALGALPDVRPAPGDWASLEARLAAEGLIDL